MQNIALKLALIIIVLGGCAFMLYPPKEKIRLGKDLRGGVSLIYSVRMDDKVTDRMAVLMQTIQVLQDRVNPQGVLDISMEPLGDDRIEIVMPLPNAEVLGLRRAYEATLERLLREAQIPPGRLDAALRANRAPEEFGSDAVSERGRMVTRLQDTYNSLQSARAAYDEAKAAGAAADELARLEQSVAQLLIDFEDQRELVLKLSLDRARVLRVMSLSSRGERQLNAQRQPVLDAAGQPVMLPSPREIELTNLKGEYPQLAALLTETAAAYDAYQSRRTGFDDPEDLKRLLRGAGVLEFRIAVRDGADDVNAADLRAQLAERGPEGTDSPVARWFEINDLRQWYETPEELAFLQANPQQFFAQRRGLVAADRDGRYYLLLYTTAARSMTHGGETRWTVRSAARDIDRHGRPAVSFTLDTSGGALMNRMTGPHVGEPMAIVLDGQVYSAPTLQSQIGSRGQITGQFSPAELSYLIRVLAAGSLEARLSERPIAENTLGPSLGEDNLRAGRDAFIIAIIAISVFMTLYYFFAGMVAVFALFANGLIIFGVMAGIDGTFTLPGLAGIVLTIGMAVDANVLIYERIREEMFTGEFDLRGAIRQGYGKALSTIVDANVTNLIVCFVLYQYATVEVKGFALTLAIGIAATLFTTLFVTRQIYYLYTDFFRKKSLPMLPTAVPAIHHFLEPNINWIGLRKMFWAVSAIGLIGSIILIGSRGVDLFDTELRGGVAVTMRTGVLGEGSGDNAERRWLRHVGPGSVEERIRAIGTNVDPASTNREATILREFARASVLTVGETRRVEGGIEGQSFQVKVPNPRGFGDNEVITDVIIRAVVDAFGEELDVTPPLNFRGEGTSDHAEFTSPIEFDVLGQNIGDLRYTERVTDFLGGVLVVIQDIQPPVQLDDVEARIARMRSQPDFGTARGRDVQVIGLDPAVPTDPSRGYSAIAVAVSDPSLSFARVDFSVWDRELAAVEWNLISSAMATPPSLEQVSSFSAAVARTLAANAQVAVLLSLAGILLYIWIRFGSLRYSLAAIAALIHDVIIALGVLALTAYLSRMVFGKMLLVEEFRIDLGVVAALLTIIGYSLNDTIVILDRIRENRGKMPLATAATINRSINQTISRTVLTSFTTLLAVLIMYIEGGSGIRAFAFCLLVGLMVGTYSSIAIAAPLVFASGGNADRKSAAEGEPEETWNAAPATD
ncbi:MAG TPA: protein translocase subunit SecD [Phycisphaerales bacterium]|nr:protein translocase subunit SecD [Phycisphaerales bacterium]HRQ75472.1 protein translocase subunit SecD [Phycisphaerales bacterium]